MKSINNQQHGEHKEESRSIDYYYYYYFYIQCTC